jgi:hypothetical protein
VQFYSPTYLNFDEVDLGRGFDIQKSSYTAELRDVLMPRCVSGDILDYRQNSGEVSSYGYLETENMVKKFSGGGKADLDFWIIGVTPSVKYFAKESSTATKKSESLSIKLNGPKYTLVNVNDIPESTSLGSEYCGDGFVQVINKGVTQVLTVSAEFFDEETKKGFEAKVKVKLLGGLIKKTFRYSDEYIKLFQNAVVTISHYANGGMTRDLVELRGGSVSDTYKHSCNYDTLSSCFEKFDSLYEYLTSDHYKELLVNYNDVPEEEMVGGVFYTTQSFGVSSYDEAGVEGLTRQLTSKTAEQFSVLAALFESLEDAYSELAKLESSLYYYESDSDEYLAILEEMDDLNETIESTNTQILECSSSESLCDLP